MPTFKDSECTKLYMRIYMHRLRFKRRIEYAALIQSRRLAFLEREHQIRESRTEDDRLEQLQNYAERNLEQTLEGSPIS